MHGSGAAWRSSDSFGGRGRAHLDPTPDRGRVDRFDRRDPGVDPKEAEKGSEQVGKADPEASESEEATEVLRVPRTPLEPPRESKPLAST